MRQRLNRACMRALLLILLPETFCWADESLVPCGFELARCQAIQNGEPSARLTLQAMMDALEVKDCNALGSRRSIDLIGGLDLSNKKIVDLSPLRLIKDSNGQINLSHNEIRDIRPLEKCFRAASFNLSHNKIEDPAQVNRVNVSPNLDHNFISDPSKLIMWGVRGFSLRNNTSKLGAAFDKALDRTLDLFSRFHIEWRDQEKTPKNFAFLKTFFNPKIAQLVTLKNTTVEAAIKDSEQFFSDKTDVDYTLVLPSFKIETRGDELIADFDLQLVWNYKEKIPSEEEEQIIVRHEAITRSELVFNKQNFLISAYREKKILRKGFLVKHPAEATNSLEVVRDCLRQMCSKLKHPTIIIPKGTELASGLEHAQQLHTGKFETAYEFVRVIYKNQPLWVRKYGTADKGNELYYLEELKTTEHWVLTNSWNQKLRKMWARE